MSGKTVALCLASGIAGVVIHAWCIGGFFGPGHPITTIESAPRQEADVTEVTAQHAALTSKSLNNRFSVELVSTLSGTHELFYDREAQVQCLRPHDLAFKSQVNKAPWACTKL